MAQTSQIRKHATHFSTSSCLSCAGTVDSRRKMHLPLEIHAEMVLIKRSALGSVMDSSSPTVLLTRGYQLPLFPSPHPDHRWTTIRKKVELADASLDRI